MKKAGWRIVLALGVTLFAQHRAFCQQPTLNRPFAAVGTRTFADSIKIGIHSIDSGVTIHYTLDGSEPTPGSTQYTGPLTFRETTTVKAIATKGGAVSPVLTEVYTRIVVYINPLLKKEKLIASLSPGKAINVLGRMAQAPRGSTSAIFVIRSSQTSGRKVQEI